MGPIQCLQNLRQSWSHLIEPTNHAEWARSESSVLQSINWHWIGRRCAWTFIYRHRAWRSPRALIFGARMCVFLSSTASPVTIDLWISPFIPRIDPLQEVDINSVAVRGVTDPLSDKYHLITLFISEWYTSCVTHYDTYSARQNKQTQKKGSRTQIYYLIVYNLG